MLTTEMIVSMIAWPAAGAALVLALGWIPAVARSRAAPMIGPLAVAVGFVVGYWVVVGRPEPSPPLDAKTRLPHVAVIGLALAAAGQFAKRRALVWAAMAIGSLLAMRLVLVAAIEFRWSSQEALLRVAVLASGMWIIALGARSFARRVPPRTASLGLAALGGLAAPLMLFADSLLMAQLHGTLGVAVAVAAAGVWIAPQRIAAGALAEVVVALGWSHWVIALLFANLPTSSFALLAAAAPAALAAGLAVERWKPRRHALAALAVLAALVTSSVALGGLRYARTTDASDEAAASPGDHSGYGYDYDSP